VILVYFMELYRYIDIFGIDQLLWLKDLRVGQEEESCIEFT